MEKQLNVSAAQIDAAVKKVGNFNGEFADNKDLENKIDKVILEGTSLKFYANNVVKYTITLPEGGGTVDLTEINNSLATKYDDVELVGNQLKFKVGSVVKKTITLPAGGGEVDLTDYYTKGETYNKVEIDNKIANAGSGGSVDLSNYQTKSDSKLTTTSKEIVGAINENKSQLDDKVNIIKSDNLFVKSTVKKGFFVQSGNGQLKSNQDYNASDIIKVKSGDGLIFRFSGQTAFYNDGVYVSGGTFTTVTIPNGVNEMRVSTLNQNLDTQQINIGATLNPYMEGGNYLEDNIISRSEMFVDNIIPERALSESIVNKINNLPSSDFLNYQNGLRKFRQCVAKTQVEEANEIYNICFVGDSITEGVGCSITYTEYLKYGYLARTRKRFNDKFGDCGNGFIPVYYADQFTLNGDWKDFTLLGVAGNCKWTSTGTATISFNGTGFAIVTQISANGGDINVSVDGVDNTLSCKGVNGIGTVKVEGLSNGSHTATISVITSGFQFMLIGGYEIKGVKGFRLNTCAKSGVSSRQLTANANIIASEIDVFSPILTVIATCTNDIGQSLTTDEYKTNMQTLITTAKKYGDVLLFPTLLRVDKADGELKPYIDVLKQLVLDNNISLIDIYHRWGRESQSLGFMDDVLHPNKIGALDLSNALTDVLL